MWTWKHRRHLNMLLLTHSVVAGHSVLESLQKYPDSSRQGLNKVLETSSASRFWSMLTWCPIVGPPGAAAVCCKNTQNQCLSIWKGARNWWGELLKNSNFLPWSCGRGYSLVAMCGLLTHFERSCSNLCSPVAPQWMSFRKPMPDWKHWSATNAVKTLTSCAVGCSDWLMPPHGSQEFYRQGVKCTCFIEVCNGWATALRWMGGPIGSQAQKWTRSSSLKISKHNDSLQISSVCWESHGGLLSALRYLSGLSI